MFQTVSSAGFTFITSENLTSFGGSPPGFEVFADSKGFSISTSASPLGPESVCFSYPNIDLNMVSRLRILHFENGVWVNRTTSTDSNNKIVCSTVSSLGQFAVVMLGPPTALIDSNSNRAVVLNSVNLVRDPISIVDSHNFSADQRARLVFFVQSVDLLPAESVALVTAQARDAQNVAYPLTVEAVS